MSRSYKKHPGYKDGPHAFMKRLASRKVRISRDVPDGGSYKKYFPTWDICDFKCVYYTKSQWLEFSAPNRSDWGTKYDEAYRSRMK